jgi:hypothetical protein
VCNLILAHMYFIHSSLPSNSGVTSGGGADPRPWELLLRCARSRNRALGGPASFQQASKGSRGGPGVRKTWRWHPGGGARRGATMVDRSGQRSPATLLVVANSGEAN